MLDRFATENVGVAAAYDIFSRFGWAFRIQSVGDFGIDAIVEIRRGGVATGKLLALQIKSGASYFRHKVPGGYLFRGKLRHLDYWTNHSLPAYLVLHNPEDKLTLCQRIDRSICNISDKGWSILIPANNKLENMRAELESGPPLNEEGQLRFAFSVDAAFMERFVNREATLVWEHWFNKTLGMRFPTFRFEDGKDLRLENYYPTSSVFEVMRVIYPWLDYEYAESIREEAGEIEVHTLNVWLRDEAKAFLKVERFFRNGLTQEPPNPPDSEPEEEDEDYEAWANGDYSEIKDPWWHSGSE